MTYPPPGGPMYPMPGGPNPFDPTARALAARRGRRRMTIILSVIVAVLALIVGLGAVKLYGDKTGKNLFPSLTLRSAGDAGPNPFTSSVALSHGTAPLRNAVPAAAQQGVRVVNGTAPGLYATGTASCDTARLGNELSADPAAGRAWASVFGIRTDEIPWYLNTLTPVVLTADTWVTNHAYRGGTAYPFQSVLEAGTPLYVDAAGVPRVVCACGNPLLPPAAAPVGGYRVIGTPWHNYQSTTITRVATSNQYVTNVNNTTTIVNNPAPAPTGPLQVQNVITGILDVITVGGTLALDPSSVPADLRLPDPVVQNAPPSFDATFSAQNGLQTDSPDSDPGMVDRAAANHDVPQLAGTESTEHPGTPADDRTDDQTASGPSGNEQTDTGGNPPVTDDGAVEPGPADPGSTGSNSPGSSSTDDPNSDALAPTESTTSSGTTTATVPTAFTGSGSIIGSLTFAAADGASVTCTRAPAPSADTADSAASATAGSDTTDSDTTGASTVTLTCDSGGDRTFKAADLTTTGVTSDTDQARVWKVTTESDDELTITSAVWQSED